MFPGLEWVPFPASIVIGTGQSASDSSHERAEARCVPRNCDSCGRPTERNAIGDYPPYHDMCLAEASRPDLTHPSMADPWARLLFRRMSEISEECYAAGWVMGNEFMLWRVLLHRPGRRVPSPAGVVPGMGRSLRRGIEPAHVSATMVGVAFTSLFVANDLTGGFHEKMSPAGFRETHAVIGATGGVRVMLVGRPPGWALAGHARLSPHPSARTLEVER